MSREIKIIYEDEHLLVIDKPSGIPTLKLSQKENTSIESEICKIRPALSNIPEAGIAHRLDNETSGLLCLGKTIEAYNKLREKFRQNEVVKSYLALVLGVPTEKGQIETPIAHHPRKKKRMVPCESSELATELKARSARTSYNTLKHYELRQQEIKVAYTLLEVKIETGVRHQIRVHLASLGFPIAGDYLYQNAAKKRVDLIELDHIFLHASHLEISHPVTNKKISFDSELPEELSKALRNLNQVKG